MTRLYNDPRAFREEMIDGFVSAYGRMVRRVPDASGIMSVDSPADGRVAVITGGGSGHYPAFYGVVGQGLASGSVIGDVFTSPSGEQAYRVARAVEGGAGVLFTFGNYSGDVMNFGMAELRLQGEGIDCRTVLVTDDVLSAPKTEADRRRGIAGGFYVFKVAGASAARGDDLATVERLTRLANDRIRTVGVAFGGCTVPGATEPLFTVAPKQMEVGLGIHGEPGVRTSELLPSREIAKVLVETILADAPTGAGGRAAVMINGLGSTKYEELFILYRDVLPHLTRAGIEPYEPIIGEFVTSLDMAGCSLTLFWLDDELQPLHDATAVTPAFVRLGPELPGWTPSRQRPPGNQAADRASTVIRTTATPDVGVAGAMGTASRAAIRAALAAIEAAEDELARLDAAAGDGDHGAGMVRGFRAAAAAVSGTDGTAQATFAQAGKAFMDSAGGASGALIGGWLAEIGRDLPADDSDIDPAAFGAALQAGEDVIVRLGRASPGDKTLLDTLHPFVGTYRAAVGTGLSAGSAWEEALAAAETGMVSTTDMVSRLGRSARLGERSRGYQDAGATSMCYVLRSFRDPLVAALDSDPIDANPTARIGEGD